MTHDQSCYDLVKFFFENSDYADRVTEEDLKMAADDVQRAIEDALSDFERRARMNVSIETEKL